MSHDGGAVQGRSRVSVNINFVNYISLLFWKLEICINILPSVSVYVWYASVNLTIFLTALSLSLSGLQPIPRSRLEIFEQACAVDSVTKKCAGKISGCRRALLGIMGTTLRTLCACQGSDMQQLYKCLGWQRLLWLNPCVGELRVFFFFLVSWFHCITHSNDISVSKQLNLKRTSTWNG